MKKEVRKCRITNSVNTWILNVDGKSIYFTGYSNADYFKELFERIGYEVEMIDASETI